MKRIACLMFGIVCLTSAAFGEGRIGPFVTGMASIGDESGSAFGGGLKGEWLFSKNLGIDLHAGYLKDSEGDMGIIPLEFGPVVVIPLDPISLTLGAGGLYAIPTDGDADAALGFYAAGGIRGPMSDGMEWFVEAQYVNVKGDDKETTTRTDYSWGYRIETITEPHLDFSAVGLNVGLLWKF